MAGNSGFELVTERGWRLGLGNMLDSEMAHWWKTRRWWVNCLLWAGLVGLMLGTVLSQASGQTSPSEAMATLYAIIAGLIPSVTVIIMMQGAVVGEKNDGTAAWILSKPATRLAFILSKVIANSLGVLVTMVLPSGVVAYTMVTIATGTPWNSAGFIAALGVIFLSIFFFLSLTIMLGTFFNSRGPVIGIALAVLLLPQLVIGMLPILQYILPWGLVIPSGEPMNAVVPCLLLGTHNYSPILILIVALESILFVLVGLYRFNREEF